MAFQIIRDDITLVSADAIVNTANPEPIYAGGTDTAIYEAAGADELLAERRKIGNIVRGQAVETPAFSLDAKYIIHTVGPAWDGGDHGERETVRSCYENSLSLAEKLGCESIAFPLIATGVYGFPKDEALQIAISVFSEFMLHSDMDITLVVFDKESFVLTGKVFSDVDAYIDENYVDEMLDEEYRIDREMSNVPMSREDGIRRKSKRGSFFSRLKEDIALSAPSEPDYAFEDSDFCEEEPETDMIPEDSSPDEIAGMFADEDSVDLADEESVFEIPDDTYEDQSATMGNMDAFKLSKPMMRSLDELDANIGETWAEMLFRLIDEKGYNPVDVYKRSNINKKLFSKINSNNDYHPNKKTAVAFAIGLHLNLDEAKDFLSCAGYAFSKSSKFDLIVQFFIERENYDMFEINEVLFDHDQDTIGV